MPCRFVTAPSGPFDCARAGVELASLTLPAHRDAGNFDLAYTGDFDFKLWGNQYASVGVGNPIAEVKGTVAGARITVE